MPGHLCAAVITAAVMTSAADVKTKKNWQDLWREDLNKCVSDNAKLFKDASGKPRTRKLGEMTKLISDEIAGKDGKDSKVVPTPSISKLSRKERMKQELKHQLSLETVFQDMDFARDKTAYYQQIREQGEQMILQMSRQSKLPFDTDLTLREWCDLVWRSGRFSPLDQDKPKQTDDMDLPDEDAKDGDMKASHSQEL